MRLLFVADGRSPIALNWIQYFTGAGHEVHLASTFACRPNLALASRTIIPVALSGMKAAAAPGEGAPGGRSRLWGASTLRLRTALRQWLGPVTVPPAARRLEDLIRRLQPDLVHAMRIPYEGMLAARALSVAPRPPLLVSVWGNDFTLHAASNPFMAEATRRALQRADALHADCNRDVRLAHFWGFQVSRPAVVLPGAGGVQAALFFPPFGPELAAREAQPIVVNPRGFRAYVRNDTFFDAVPRVLRRRPGVRFLCPAMQGDPQAGSWLAGLTDPSCVELLPRLPRAEMAVLFRRAQVTVSPSTHDGTPNTLLEAMACGSFPIAGDIESLREWITPGVNGLLVDPSDPQALADAILDALDRPDLRAAAQQENARLVSSRAAYEWVMPEAERFYRQLIAG